MRAPLLAVAAVLCLALGGCVQTVAEQTVRGAPDGYEGELDLLDPEPFATWVDDGARFAVVTFGSSSCAPVPVSVESTETATIAVTFVEAPAPVCTADLGPTTHVFATPAEIDAGGAVTVRVLLDYATDYEYTLRIEG